MKKEIMNIIWNHAGCDDGWDFEKIEKKIDELIEQKKLETGYNQCKSRGTRHGGYGCLQCDDIDPIVERIFGE